MTDLTMKDFRFTRQFIALELLREGLLAMLATLATWRRRQRGRRELARLSARDLKDIGLSPSQAAFEVGKPVWKD
jgi:uncharacterized protein YjiS (DUF1127 family)